MFQSLNVAFRNQKKLILIFLLTIFLPSVTLSIFGLIALRNERYRIEQQFREEQMEFIEFVKSEVNLNESHLSEQFFAVSEGNTPWLIGVTPIFPLISSEL